MPHIGEWLRRIWYRLNRGRLEAALQEEMDAHRAMVGDPRRFGNTLRLREQSRDVWGWAWLDDLVRDLRFAARGLVRTPVFTLTAILSIALGLALAASTVSVVNAYLIRSLPYAAADRLYHVMYAPPGPWEPHGMTGLDWSSVEDIVEFPIASAGESFYFGGGGHTLALHGLRVTQGFVDGLGVSVALGRGLMEPDFVAGSEPVALMGHSLWRDRFGSDPGVIGRSIRTEPESRPGRPETFQIVGVLAPGFYFGRDRTAIELLVPYPAPLRAYMVRLRAGVPPGAAERRLTDAARLAATSPIPPEWTGVRLESAHERWIGDLRPILFGVAVAVSLVLVIACANVTVLLLLRWMQRQKEIAVRLALGSGWRHIARMLVAETSLLCTAALGAGMAMTALLLRAASPLIESQLGRPAPNPSGISIDTTVLLVVAGVGLLIVVTLPLAPLTSGRRGLRNALQQDGRVASERRSMRRLRSGLIALEIAGSLVLLVGSGLMVRSVVEMLSTDLGFRPDGLSRSRIMLRARNYPDAAAYREFHERFADRVSEATGSTVVFSSWPPFVPPPIHLIESEAAGAGSSAGAIGVSAGYFVTMGIPIRQGREFTSPEASTGASVAIVSETLAGRLWPDGRALGRRVRAVEQTQGNSNAGPWRTVVGIAGDVRQTYDDGDQGDFYTARTPDGRFGTFYVRTGRPAPWLVDLFQRAAAEIDPDAVINPPRLVAGDNRTLAGTTFLTWLLTGFGAMAGLLATLGLYGVTAYAVQQRSKEVAIRVALGASERAVIGLFLRQGVLLLGMGTTVGLVGSAALSRVLRSQVFGVQGFDPPAYVVPCAVLLATGVTAAFAAARRAALADPVGVLNAN
ncbi:MAG TPA: ABC transporter permease [Vicinamibacterales bacterium]|nr:ABC transporter permease [Vicinamibacterales bacterium]